MSLKKYREKESNEFRKYRNDFRDNYSFMENYCKKEFNSGNYLDLISKKTNLIEACPNEIIELIKQDYIKSNDYRFQVKPDVKNATDFLREKLLNTETEHQYKKSLERAVYELLQVIRDNLTHYGKFEISDKQYDRNLVLIKNAAIISFAVINAIEN